MYLSTDLYYFIKDISNKIKKGYRRYYPYSENSIFPFIIISFFLKTRDNQRCNSSEILKIFVNGIIWKNHFKSFYFCLLATSMILSINLQNTWFSFVSFIILSIAYIMIFLMDTRGFPFYYRYRINYLVDRKISYFLFYILGGMGLLFILEKFKPSSIFLFKELSLLFTGMILFFFGLSNWRARDIGRKLLKHSILKWFKGVLNLNLYFFLIVLFYAVTVIFPAVNINVNRIFIIISFVYMGWIIYVAKLMHSNWKKILKAKDLANKSLDLDFYDHMIHW